MKKTNLEMKGENGKPSEEKTHCQLQRRIEVGLKKLRGLTLTKELQFCNGKG